MDVERLRTRLAQGVSLLLVALSGCASVFGPTTAMSFMHLVESSPDPNVRYKAYQGLGSARVYDEPSQKAAAAKLLLENLDPKKEPLATRAVICRTLGELGDPIAREAMVKLVRDPDPMIRAEAYRALGKVGRKEDSTVLMQAMTLDRDDHCKVAAIEALGMLKEVDPRTEAYLVRTLDSSVEDPRIRYASLNSLRKISRKDFGAKPEPWRAYVLAKYGEKIEPPAPPVAVAADRDPRSFRDGRLAPAVGPPPRPVGQADRPVEPDLRQPDRGRRALPDFAAQRPRPGESRPDPSADPTDRPAEHPLADVRLLIAPGPGTLAGPAREMR